MSRDNVSWPNWLVPSQWAGLGGASAREVGLAGGG